MLISGLCDHFNVKYWPETVVVTPNIWNWCFVVKTLQLLHIILLLAFWLNKPLGIFSCLFKFFSHLVVSHFCGLLVLLDQRNWEIIKL